MFIGTGLTKRPKGLSIPLILAVKEVAVKDPHPEEEVLEEEELQEEQEEERKGVF